MKKIFIISIIFIFGLICCAAELTKWAYQPIHVYIPQYGNMSVLMKQAFSEWQNTSRNLVTFRYVNSPDKADIEVEFVDFVTNCSSDNSVGCTHWTTKRGRQFGKALVTIGTKEYIYDKNSGLPKSVTRTKEHIYGVMLHEAGHAIGLDHSTNKDSIMYPYDLESMQYLTKEDMKLLYNKYH